MPIADPQSWKLLPFRDLTAWIDWLGQHDLQHRQFAASIRAKTSKGFAILPLGDGGHDYSLGGTDQAPSPEWHQAHQLVHQGETTALSIAAPPDFTAYDLNDPNDFATYCYLHAAQHITERLSIGL